MHHTLFLYLLFVKLYEVVANSYSVGIGTDKHVNLIDKRFLSFTIDPKYLFSNNEKYKRYVGLYYLLILIYYSLSLISNYHITLIL